MRSFLSLALLSALSSALASPLLLRSVATEFPDPNDDPFYKAPPKLSSYALGQVIRSRAVNTTITAGVKSSYQVLYRTSDTQKNAEATVATIWQPLEPKSPAQILSYHSYMDSDSFDCSPSWAFVQGSASQGKPVTSLDAPIFIEWALSQGIYVVDPDDEGPKAAFIAGYQQGYSALDGIRATKNFYKLPKKTEIAQGTGEWSREHPLLSHWLTPSSQQRWRVCDCLGRVSRWLLRKRPQHHRLCTWWQPCRHSGHLQLSQWWSLFRFRRSRPCGSHECIPDAKYIRHGPHQRHHKGQNCRLSS
jgi:hypothetical protein